MIDGAISLPTAWQEALHLLSADPAISAQQMGFIRLVHPFTMVSDVVVVAAPNEFTKDVLAGRLDSPIAAALSLVMGREVRLHIDVDAAKAPPLGEDEDDEIADSYIPQPPTRGTGRGAPGAVQANDASEDSPLNPKYLFETFVIGSSNRFAHAAAVAVAEQPARAYNPLFIYGDSGLGKTHLLHAIGHYTRMLVPNARVRYVSSEKFTNDFINAIRDDRGDAFQSFYRSMDVLLVDDIQFLSNKVQTQEEFFHTFNTLHNEHKQIVVTSDLPPKKLADFEDRMRSRFEWGLITDIQPPDLETRIAILRKKKQQEGFEVPESALEYIASRISSNIRELEGALIRVKAYANLNRMPVDMEITRSVLDNLLPDGGAGPEITPESIMEQTAAFFAVSMDDLTGTSRSRTLVQARQIAMYLCRELTLLSLPKIGQIFGGRDHTTVMHAERKVRNQMQENRKLFDQVSELTNRIKSATTI